MSGLTDRFLSRIRIGCRTGSHSGKTANWVSGIRIGYNPVIDTTMEIFPRYYGGSGFSRRCPGFSFFIFSGPIPLKFPREKRNKKKLFSSVTVSSDEMRL
jgi:hypothetical protein